MARKPDSTHGQAQQPDGRSGGLRQALQSGRFAVTAEIGPPRGADAEPVRRTAALLRGWVDAVNITDNQSAAVRLSSLAGSLVANAAGVPPIMQLTCRDRNRIALQSDLLSASALGIPNVLLMTGDHPRFGDHADAKAVFDLDSTQLLRVARTMRDEGTLMSGRALTPPPSWFIGAVENPADPPEASAARLGQKVDAGAEFVQTQFVFDVAAFARWMDRVRDLGLHERCHVLAGVGPVLSLGALDHLQHRVPGVQVPEPVADRLRKAGPERIRDEGAQLCAEIIRELREVPGVAGVHVMAIGNQAMIPGILEQAGLASAGQAAVAAGQAAGSSGTGSEQGEVQPEAVPEDSLLEEGLLDDEPETG